NYIYDQLEAAGVVMLTPRDGEDFYITGKIAQGVSRKDTIHSRNVIGIVPGYDKELNSEYIVIGAHIDHLGVNRVTIDGEERLQIYSGADDNASGVATLIELAKEIASNRFLFRRSVLFAFFGAEEIGMAGSWYFLNRSFKEVENIVMMINLDMIGRSSADNKFQIFTGLRNLELNTIVHNLKQRPASIQPELSYTDYFPSDHRLFAEKEIPIALFTTGVHRDYHTPKDTPDRLDYTQMEKIAEFGFALAQNIANRQTPLPVGVVSHEGATEEETYYTQRDVDKRAQFLHGDETQFLTKWVYPYLKYPQSSIEGGEFGRVYAEFIIEKDGKVTNVVITKGVSNAIDDEVVKVISASPKWKPAKLRGENVRVKTSVAVDFKLSKNGEFGIKK
ncbi:MAG: M20/M25/M40 family metallo-hydrolase, partial [Bacteroidales bacterium]|nr:M20/M25/M40 family metallo-hydrolase [Bacteroidales bacterium]